MYLCLRLLSLVLYASILLALRSGTSPQACLSTNYYCYFSLLLLMTRCQEHHLSTEAAVENCFLTILQACSAACGLQPQHVLALRSEVELVAEALRTRAVAVAHRYAWVRDETGPASPDTAKRLIFCMRFCRRRNTQGTAAIRIRATQARDAALHPSGKW